MVHSPFNFMPLRSPQEALVVISFDYLIGTNVPHHHCAATILTFRNYSFKIKIIDRMILGRHCKPSLLLLEWWTFGNGPGPKNVVHFEPKVIMQVACGM